MNNENRQEFVQEDEIDLRELWATLMRRKKLIVGGTTFITILAIAYVLLATPVFEATMKLRIGSQVEVSKTGEKETRYFQDAASLKYEIGVVFDKEKVPEGVFEYISEIRVPNKLAHYLEISARAHSNDIATALLDKVFAYINDKHEKEYLIAVQEKKFKIKQLEQLLDQYKTVTYKRLNLELKSLKSGPLVDVENQISYAKQQENRQIEKRIEIIKKLDVTAIDEEITFIKEVSIPIIVVKISEYEKTIKSIKQHLVISKELVEANKLNNPALASISLFDVRTDERKVLKLVNDIFALKQEKLRLEQRKIAQLKRKKDRLKEQAILDLAVQSQKITQIRLPQLQHQKNTLLTETIPAKKVEIEKLLNETIPNTEEEISELKLHTVAPYLVKTKVVDKYVVSEFPVKPKKTLIVVVAFITGLMLSVFLAFFLEFIKGGRKVETSDL